MNRHHAFPNGYAANKKRDDDVYNKYSDRSDLESKYIWGMRDLVDDEKPDSTFTRKFEPRNRAFHNRSRLIRLGLFALGTLAIILWLLFPSATHLSSWSSSDSRPQDHSDIETLRYYDLEDVQGTSVGWEREERVLLCTPLRDAAAHLPMFFAHLRNFTYPHHLIDLAFLVSDSKDDTEELLSKMLEELQADPDSSQPYGEISVIHKDFGQTVNQDFESRHGFAAQASRRKLMAQARNWLLSAALRPYHSWVYWRDADVETCPYTIIEDLMRHDKDIIVPNIWRPLPDWLGGEQPYDLNSWQESETAIALAETLDEDAVIVEGYAEYATWRPHLAYLRDPYGDPDVEMELDGVGGVSILAKARVFRAGVHFPAFSFERHAETEGFGKMARRMQFSVVGLPHYTVWHLYEPSVDDIRHMEEMEAQKREREKKEKEEAEKAKKVQEEFQQVDSQWEKDKQAMADRVETSETTDDTKQKDEKADPRKEPGVKQQRRETVKKINTYKGDTKKKADADEEDAEAKRPAANEPKAGQKKDYLS
ncbi:Mannan polymerase II complex anp1 subunit [Exophiala xenobiotica]|uniref:Mannan polymerase II complex anp1 subunit n=1 Tax=Vermiconidia calcicola TaxID=1690605 RepID=A0AAV9QE43_9PEZI|nr:Mannan polymerase II complex anp1 subunit [Exophiala xenobiotica]KAK5537911.1 Mannan polymerase II complex anp1 subunit [Chaetothyriales sp. CCFEE 6169]KAK5539635.1 Mannan polymerase II complex anp1 subunit [Vermiconidia calcicola]KAK5303899.1 Mannan polymerase II complex anp1 subunit [Exophiala xenobiotica]KAK5338510.1 Mannan polymerase II complex anp1 subunit [Exophiala xenobiotica]